MTKTTMHLKDVDHAVQDTMSALRKAIAENIAHDDLFELASVRKCAENLCEAIRRQIDQDIRMQDDTATWSKLSA